jgi:hypothetical protein
MWEALEFLIGTWAGTGGGETGDGTYARRYELVLNGQFLFVHNKSTYPPQEKNPGGEVHEDWGLISFDKARKTFILRQFHVEGFVNQYILDHIAPDGKEIVFTTEAIENIAAGWRARETYKILSDHEYIEIFELAAPNKEFKEYTHCHMMKTDEILGSSPV